MHIGRRVLPVLIGTMLFALRALGAAAQPIGEVEQRQILVIYSDTSTLSANIGVAKGLRDVLHGQLSPHDEVHTEFRAIQHFPGAEDSLAFVEMLARKYGDERVDLVVALGPAALEIAMRHRDRFARGATVVGGGVTERTIPEPLPDYLTVALGSFDLAETVALARRMQPDARRIVVFTGSSEFDESWKETARNLLADETGIEVEYVSDCTIAEFEAVAAALAPDTILLILTIFEDASGARFTPAEVAALIAARSGAPSWGVYSTFLGDGVVGGVFTPFETIGRTVGELALDALNGNETGARLVPVPSTPVVDWPALGRYGLDESLLPDGVVLLNHDPPVWDRYRAEILLVLCLVLVQTGTIAALVVQGRRRRAAEMEVAARRLELAQLARHAQLGELSGAITHELNQPLTSILANAEAGSILLRNSPPNIEEISSILHDIAVDNQRASNIIASLRKLMRRKEVDPEPIDLNTVVKAVESLTKSELLMRGVRLVVRATPGPLMVLGDMEQFQQVLLNLILNGADAMADQPADTRILEVETTERVDGWRQIVVQDSGPGLSVNVRGDPFRAFVTTKENGMGMGLSICLSIAKAHSGALAFEQADKGARVVFALPPA